MSKQCAKCSKTVYPTEELKCLDKVWHKACFKCEVCGMTLNMKNYKGYNKVPYCNAHYPQTKFTAVADTPENRRIAENTKIQSQVKYHEDFEKNIKGSKIEVADDPETRRIQQHGKIISQAEYKNIRGNRDEQEQRRQQANQEPMPSQGRRQIGSISDYDPDGRGDEVRPSPYSSRYQGHSTAYPVSPPPPQPAPEPVRQPYYPAPAQPPPAQQPMMPPPPAAAPAPPRAPQVLYQAMYDYDAQDDDEVTFRDGDYIIDIEPIDEGWMYGTVQRTGVRGMLPANYVERV